MKKRLTALFMTVVMAVGTMSLAGISVSARPSDTELPLDSGYEFRNTEGLETDYVNGNLILTWPSVSKDGQLLNSFNPLASSDSDWSAPGNPAGGWTMPYQGVLVKYNGWFPGYSPSKVSITLTGDEDIMKGVVADAGAEGQQTVLDYAYNSDAKLCLTGKSSHIDETVVAKGFAKSYRVDYKKSGSDTWLQAGTAGQIDHQKKLCLPADTEGAYPKTDVNGLQYVEDNKNTVFLITQQVEVFPSTVELEENAEYDIRVVSLDASGAEIPVDEAAFSTTVKAAGSNTIKVPAFPTVEGGGIWTSGGRTTLSTQGQVYVVTSLEDSVSDPQPGTLRYGLTKARAGESTPLTIVFAVGGTIHIDPTATKSQRRFVFGSNLTVAGQTAPGEGITIAGGTCNVSGKNIIMRYVRFRTGEGYDIDGATVSGQNIVIDHCSFSWGIDETFSAKELVDSTVSYNIVANGLAMVNKNGDNNTDVELATGEQEFKHGMGSLINGYDTTITHNVWAHNGTRNPRFEGGFDYNGQHYTDKMEFANNVVYNWGHNSAYGGDRGASQINFEGNYYKTGPNTLEKVKEVFFDCDPPDSSFAKPDEKSTFYINGNFMYGNDALNNDNTKGFKDMASAAKTSASKFELSNPYEATDAQTAYDAVIAGVGASLHRDAQDDRLIAQIKNGTGRFINSEKDAGGYITIDAAAESMDGDNDGIPDSYETLLGSDPTAADSTTLITDEASPFYGYTNLEIYINDLTNEWGKNGKINGKSVYKTADARTVTSDQIAIKAIKDESGSNVLKEGNTDLIAGKTYTVELAGAADLGQGGIYFNDAKVGEGITFTPENVGSYLMQAVYIPNNAEGYNPITISDIISVTVLKNTDNITGFTAAKIGSPRADGAVSFEKGEGGSTGGVKHTPTGDVDRSGTLTANDAATLMSFIRGGSNPVDKWSTGNDVADVNGDGKVTSDDAIAILAKTLNPSYPFAETVEGETDESENGTLVIEGTGLIGFSASSSNQTDDAFFYDYKEMDGDFDVAAKVDEWEKIDYYQKAGIMVRESTDTKAEFYMNTVTYIKGEEYSDHGAKNIDGQSALAMNVGPVIRTATGSNIIGTNYTTISQYMSIPKKRASEEPNPVYMRIKREGQKITMYASMTKTDGEVAWRELASYDTTLPERCLVGFAVDSAQDTTEIIKYNKAEFSEITGF